MKFWISLACSSLAAAAALSLCPLAGEENIYADVLRLRVVAASDEAEDQADKLAVRDAVLETVAEKMADCRSRKEAEASAVEMLEEIAAAAERCLTERGNRERVSVRIGWERSPRRAYDGAVLPAGRYRTLRVTIGEGAGRNWWCVLFPGICAGFSEKDGESAAVGLTPQEYRIITGAGDGRLRVKFWILEKLAELCGRAG